MKLPPCIPDSETKAGFIWKEEPLRKVGPEEETTSQTKKAEETMKNILARLKAAILPKKDDPTDRLIDELLEASDYARMDQIIDQIVKPPFG